MTLIWDSSITLKIFQVFFFSFLLLSTYQRHLFLFHDLSLIHFTINSSYTLGCLLHAPIDPNARLCAFAAAVCRQYNCIMRPKTKSNNQRQHLITNNNPKNGPTNIIIQQLHNNNIINIPFITPNNIKSSPRYRPNEGYRCACS